jgi:ACT domain-containing protein
MKLIFDKIKKSAQNGDVNVNFDLTDNQSKCADMIIKKLESLGYKVSRQNGYDQRENTSWDYLYINWKEIL